MPFSEVLKVAIRRKSHFRYCICRNIGVEIHHIIPQESGGLDIEDNAAPLCPTCHDVYGANPQKRKFIREARDFHYEFCENFYNGKSAQLDGMQRILENLNSMVQGSHNPLLPFGLFYTLCHTTTDEAIERDFKGVHGYKNLKSDILKFRGTARLFGHAPYNAINFDAQESHCTLSKESRASLVENHTGFGESVIKHPNHTLLEFFFHPSDTDAEEPSLILTRVFEGRGEPRDITDVQLFDKTLFQDSFVSKWNVKNPSKRVWGITDLQNARVRLTLEYWSFDKINFEQTPRFHNLHFYFGRHTPHILYFTEGQLDFPKISNKSSIIAKLDFSALGMDASPLILQYEFRIDDEVFNNQITQIG